MDQRRARQEILVVFFAVFLTLKILQFLLPLISDHVSFRIAAAVVMLAASFEMIRRRTESPEEFGLRLAPLAANLRQAATIGLPVLVLFLAGYLIWHAGIRHQHLHLHFQGLPAQILMQFVAVALPEETFFRGYMQGRLEIEERNSDSHHAAFGIALILPAVLFGVAHFLMNPSPQRLATFFPGLLFGYLRARTGSIAAPVFIHTAANMIVFILEGAV